MPQITDIFFDLDHTLWDFDKNSELAFERVFTKYNVPLSVSEFIEVYNPINFNYWKLFREEKIKKQELRRKRLTDTFDIFNLSFTLKQIDAIAVAYIEEMPKDNHLFEGTIELLDYLSKKYTLHIITNGFHDVQHLKLKNSRIDNYFRTVTTSEEVGVKKPNPVIFHTAIEKAKTAASKSIMIGDTFEADILGAEGVGMQTLFYNYRNQLLPKNYRVVDQLLEIKRYL